jgi:hypothetical protein
MVNGFPVLRARGRIVACGHFRNYINNINALQHTQWGQRPKWGLPRK